MKEIHVIKNDQFSIRELTALNLCRKILEDCEKVYSGRYAYSPEGELITFNSALEIFDGIIERGNKQ